MFRTSTLACRGSGPKWTAFKPSTCATVQVADRSAFNPAQVEALVAGFQTGKTMQELAAEFGINRLTVSSHVRRAGARALRGGLDEEQAVEAIRLYEPGWSSGNDFCVVDL